MCGKSLSQRPDKRPRVPELPFQAGELQPRSNHRMVEEGMCARDNVNGNLVQAEHKQDIPSTRLSANAEIARHPATPCASQIAAHMTLPFELQVRQQSCDVYG